jgi:hypothetical protein
MLADLVIIQNRVEVYRKSVEFKSGDDIPDTNTLSSQLLADGQLVVGYYDVFVLPVGGSIHGDCFETEIRVA